MNPQIRNSGDVVVDNIEYLADIVADMMTIVDKIGRSIPERNTIHELAFSEDIGQVNEVNRVMADTSTLVWSAEKTKELLINLYNDLSPDNM